MGVKAASRNDTKQGTAGDAWSATIELDFPTWWISLECWGNFLDARLTYNGSTFADPMKIDPTRPLLIPYQAVGLQVKNTEAGKNSDYQVIGLE